jgi:hypothetical protein
MEPSQDIFDLVEDCFVRRVWGLCLTSHLFHVTCIKDEW